MVRRGCGVRVCVKCMVRLSLWICRHAQRSAPEQQAIVRPLSAKSHVSIPTRIVSQCLLTSNPASNGSTIGTAGANPFSVWRTNDVEGSIVILRAGKSIRPFDAVGKRININPRSPMSGQPPNQRCRANRSRQFDYCALAVLRQADWPSVSLMGERWRSPGRRGRLSI